MRSHLPTHSLDPDPSCRRRLLVSPLVVALLAIGSGCGNSERSDMVDALEVALDDYTIVDLTPDSRTCVAEELVDSIGLETLAEDEITTENVASRLYDGSFFVYLSGIETAETFLDCMNEEELAETAALDFMLGDEVASCVVDELGKDDTRDYLLESARSGESGEGWDEAANDCAEQAAGPAIDLSGEAAVPVPTTRSTTTAPPQPTLPSFADSMPAHLAGADFAGARLWGAKWSGNQASGYRLPVVFYEDATAPNGSVFDDGSAKTTSVDPTGRWVAHYYEATAVERERLTFTSLATGNDEESIEFDSAGAGISDLQWSPDGRALVFRLGRGLGWTLHRVGSGSTTFDWRNPQIAFASNDSMTALVICHDQGLLINMTTEGTVSKTERPDCRHMAQALDSEGNPFALVAGGDTNVGRIDAGDTAPLITSVGTESWSLFSCQGSVGSRDIQGNTKLLATATAGGFVAAPLGQNAECPIASPDGSALAYTTTSGTVEVLTPSTGTRTEVALSGVPLSFDVSGDHLLVDGGGLFVVAADGSGGSEATVPESVEANRQASFCRIGNTGNGLLAKDGTLGIFDIAANKFTQLIAGSLGPSCRISADENWVITDDLVINVSEGKAATLHATDLANGNRVLASSPTEGQKTTHFRWAGPSTETATLKLG